VCVWRCICVFVGVFVCFCVCVLCLCVGLLTLGLCFFYLNEMTRSSPALFEKKKMTTTKYTPDIFTSIA
jgi:hypothetical protein